MCWISKIKPIIRVAESDIPVEKVLRVDDGVLCSPVYSESRWEIGKEYTCEIGDYYHRDMSVGHIFGYADMSLNDFEVRKGFHSCREISQDSYNWLSVSALGNVEFIPAWSLSALFKLLPIFTEPIAFSVNVSVPSVTKTDNGWLLKYDGDFTPNINNGKDTEAPVELLADNPIDAAFEMICRLKENGKI